MTKDQVKDYFTKIRKEEYGRGKDQEDRLETLRNLNHFFRKGQGEIPFSKEG